jgi:hypothetical protein
MSQFSLLGPIRHINIFGEKVYFGRYLILERRPDFGLCTIVGKKVACKRKINVARRKENLTMIGLGFFTESVTTIIL